MHARASDIGAMQMIRRFMSLVIQKLRFESGARLGQRVFAFIENCFGDGGVCRARDTVLRTLLQTQFVSYRMITLKDAVPTPAARPDRRRRVASREGIGV